ncbi:hypothetical protein BJF90_11915 [Pseudonocardia sp. CNS-004]|nr:hypothetical protein BJF90_11915 [Pseudonocardia sp. CNS-004]
MNAPVPRVRRDEVRRRLLDAAAEVFARRGYDTARLEEIAHAAGLTTGAVYSNFAGEHALLAELIDRHARTQLAVGSVEVGPRAVPGRRRRTSPRSSPGGSSSRARGAG